MHSQSGGQGGVALPTHLGNGGSLLHPCKEFCSVVLLFCSKYFSLQWVCYSQWSVQKNSSHTGLEILEGKTGEDNKFINRQRVLDRNVTRQMREK